jgi:signal transduction histidine kinase
VGVPQQIQRHLLKDAAALLALAVERFILRRTMGRPVQVLRLFSEVSRTMATVLKMGEMLQRICELIQRGFGLCHVQIFLLDGSGDSLELRAGYGTTWTALQAENLPIALMHPYSLIARSARERTAIIVNDVSMLTQFLRHPLLTDTRSEMAIPMIVGDRLLGVLDLQASVIGNFSAVDVQIHTVLGEQISVALQNAILYQRELETSQKLRELDRLKSDMFANISHELRTPLNSIIGFAEMMIDGLAGPVPAPLKENLEAIYHSGQYLSGVISNILDSAKIEAGFMTLDLVSVDLAVVVAEVIQIATALLNGKPVALNVAVPEGLPPLHADPVRLRQILFNLVGNAVKFTESGEIRISAKRITPNQHSHNGFVEIAVQDTGIGIAAANLGLIFEKFRQADSGAIARTTGTGLGLSITRHLVHLHHGQITVASTPGQGSVFTFTIPTVAAD